MSSAIRSQVRGSRNYFCQHAQGRLGESVDHMSKELCKKILLQLPTWSSSVTVTHGSEPGFVEKIPPWGPETGGNESQRQEQLSQFSIFTLWCMRQFLCLKKYRKSSRSQTLTHDHIHRHHLYLSKFKRHYSLYYRYHCVVQLLSSQSLLTPTG